eukprot:2967251-Rhodomonas_salina.1
MQCPVLTEALLLHTCDAKSRTDIAYGGCGGGGSCDARQVAHLLCCYAYATRCPVLTETMLLCVCYAMSGTDRDFAAMRMLCDV